MAKVSEGPELDLAVAEACKMNATIYYNHELSKNVCLLLPSEKAFSPSSDLNDAFYAASLAGLFDASHRVLRKDASDGTWEVGDVLANSDVILASEDTPSLAICAAILKVLGK